MITTKTFREQMRSGGAWVLAEPSEAIKRFNKYKKIANPAPNVEMYSAIQKYIETNKHIVIVTLDTPEMKRIEGCGVEVYHKEDVEISDAVNVLRVVRKKPLRIDVSSENYFVQEGFRTEITNRGRAVLFPNYVLSPAFKDALFETGYITPEEYNAYNSLAVASCLPHIIEEYDVSEEEGNTELSSMSASPFLN